MAVQPVVRQEVADDNVVEGLNFACAVMTVAVVVVVVREHQLFEMDLVVLEYLSIDSLVNHNKDDHVKEEVQAKKTIFSFQINISIKIYCL
jgi:hypothetical protein